MPSKVGGVDPDGSCINRQDGIVVGQIVAVAEGQVMVSYQSHGHQRSLAETALVSVSSADEGREVVLAFVSGDPLRPIVMGFVEQTFIARPVEPEATNEPVQLSAEIDGERIVLDARKELVLRCGKASITMTKAGKIIIKGAYVSTSSTGVNRVKGGSVQLN